MARLTVDQIMKQVAASVNQEAVTPTTGGSEYTLWIEYMNRGLQEWEQAADWEALRKRYWPTIATSTATVAMPTDFKKLAAPPKLYNDQYPNGHQYPEVMLEQRELVTTNDDYIEVMGNPSDGYNVIFNPSLGSGASVALEYFATAPSLVSAADISVVPDPQYLVDRTIAYIFEARSDSRFQIVENRARDRLMSMLENENTAKFNSYAGQSRMMTPEKLSGFRLGRD